jgi:hypothetical protein
MNRIAEAAIGSWQLNSILVVQSGLPFNPSTPGAPGGRPDATGKVAIYPGNTARYFDTAALQPAPLNSDGAMLRPGTLGRNVLIGPGSASLDLSLFKNFALTEGLRLEFRAESFNLTNSPVYSNPNTDISSRNFGQITGTALASERQMQLALRLIF